MISIKKGAREGNTPDLTNTRTLACLLLAVLFIVFQRHSLAADSCDPWVAKVVSAQGQIEVVQIGQTRWRAVGRQETFCTGDQIRAEARSRATIRFHDSSNFTLDAGTTLTFSEVSSEKGYWVELLEGAIYFFSRVPHRLNIKTPFINAAVEGTELVLRVGPDEAALWVLEGRVSFANSAGSLSLTSGEAAVAQRGKAPMRQVIVKPREAVQWALYYPPIIDSRLATTDAPGVQEALAQYRRNSLPAAFAKLDKVPQGSRNARYFTLRAGLLLNVGRVDGADSDIAQALRLDPNHGAAYALQSVIAVTQNEQEQALRLARKAADLDPQSPLPQAALSYAYQANKDIVKASESARKAVDLAPDDGLALARLAELELSRGYLNRAMDAAKKAAALEPRLARTQSVLGFAYLTEIDIDAAKDAFYKAIQLDPAAPLPRLGLGLAKIRDGDLQEGTKEIELAASLDPNNAIVRSYLGKAYFEEKRGGQAQTEFDIAKELDPNDPTPWFYDALQKQTTNRPVEALHDLRKAIALNDNRAVYRSSLLLDQDEAARSAALGRIYNDLGFGERALVEGWSSLTTDPGNYSAHRLLADTYASRPRHEIARVSELLQSQLLQPINITPVQPNLAESSLLVLEGGGPSDASFNEFNPLFTRNRVALQTSGLIGDNGTFGDEVTQSGVWGKFSYSLGQFHFENNGFRQNNDVDQDIYNVFLQAAVTPKLNVQAEYRHRDREIGDLRLNFDPGNFFPNQREEVDQDTVRLGIRYALAPHSDLIVSGFYGDRDQKIDDPPVFHARGDSKGHQVEAQYIFRHQKLNITAGGGHYNIDSNNLALFVLPPPFGTTEIRDEFETEHNNAYFYTNLLMPNRVTWTLGLSYDSFEEPNFELDKINPKLGMQWDITDKIRLRAAYLRTVKRALVVNQTIEPTQVAGFNQFFDDTNGTEAERYGIGMDAVFSKNLYGGLEYARRDLKLPGSLITTGETIRVKREEDLYRGYLYWTPHAHWAVNTEVRYEQFRRPSTDPSVTFGGDPIEVEMVSVPLDVRYFSPTGLFAELGGTFVRQQVDFSPASTFDKDNDEFFVLNAAIGYRLPKRLGIISLEARNLLDKEFLFQDLNAQRSGDPIIPTYIPDRAIFLRATLAFN